MRAIRLRIIAFAILLSAFAFVSFTQPTYAATNCHQITDAERAALKSAGATIPANGQFCDEDKVLIYGDCSDDPRAFLQTKNKSTPEHVQGLNSDFACRLEKFIKAGDAAGVNITLNSGFRSVERQSGIYKTYLSEKAAGRNPAPVAPPGRSKHNVGQAYDLFFDGKHSNFGLGNGNTARCIQTLPSCKWAHENASKFGLRFPMLVEPWHIEPGTAVKGEKPQLLTDPNYWASDSGTTYTGAPLPVSQPLQQPIMSPAPVGTSPQSGTTQSGSSGTTNAGSQSQPQICNPSYSCSAGTMYYQTTSCTTQVYQLCVYGCDGNACKTASTTSSTLNTVTGAFSSSSTSTSDTEADANTNSNTNTNDNTSISDILNSLSIGDLFTSTDVGTSVPLSLNSSINQIGSLQSGSSTYPAGTAVATGTIQSYQPIGGQSTFTSQDLVYLPQAVITRTSATFSILEGMKNALLGALNFLLSLGR